MTTTATTHTLTVTATYEVTDEFLQDILVTAVEGGVNYWATVSEYDPDAGTVKIHEDGVGPGVLVTSADILKALEKTFDPHQWIGQPGYARPDHKLLMEALVANDAGEVDAGVAETLVQVAVLGTVVYG